MCALRIIILKDGYPRAEQDVHSVVITFEEFKEWVKKGIIFKHFLLYKEACLLTYRLGVVSKPFIIAILLRFMSRESCYFEDERGSRLKINTGTLIKLLWQSIRDFFRKPIFLRQIYYEVEQLSSGGHTVGLTRALDLSGTPAYLRTDLVFGLRSGGSVGHIAGVLNNLDNFTGKPLFLSTDNIPTVRADIKTHIIFPEAAFRDFREVPSIFYNRVFERVAYKALGRQDISFIYQRYGLNNFSGVKLSRTYGVPLVLEYNGSEIWINRNWDKPLKYETLSERIEMLNLEAADVIVVVSQPIKNQLLERGIKESKILVNPNGVNPERYSPAVDGSTIRNRYRLDRKVVIGFIGTFGKWHGAEILAEAFGRLLRDYPDYKGKIHLLMIGDGVTMSQVKEKLAKYSVLDVCTLTGIVPQDDGPAHLAACDILVSPHVPNPDGTPFFGSPTKLFEYMAMGKGIVASDLDQIGEILGHNKTAWMVKPGDVDSLVEGLKTLIGDRALRERLGKVSREEVVSKYTWKEHTKKIVSALKELV